MMNELIKEQLLNESKELDMQLEQEHSAHNYDYLLKKRVKLAVTSSMSGHLRPRSRVEILQQKKKLH